MFDRIFRNWKTTTLGILVIFSAILTVFMKLSTWTEVGAFLALSMALFFSKDPK
jgi:uncharacterized membrane protein HdeD (DUF308 family)